MVESTFLLLGDGKVGKGNIDISKQLLQTNLLYFSDLILSSYLIKKIGLVSVFGQLHIYIFVECSIFLNRVKLADL